MNILCPKCHHNPDDEPDHIYNYVDSSDQVLLCCPRCGYSWLIEPRDMDKPPEGFPDDISGC